MRDRVSSGCSPRWTRLTNGVAALGDGGWMLNHDDGSDLASQGNCESRARCGVLVCLDFGARLQNFSRTSHMPIEARCWYVPYLIRTLNPRVAEKRHRPLCPSGQDPRAPPKAPRGLSKCDLSLTRHLQNQAPGAISHTLCPLHLSSLTLNLDSLKHPHLTHAWDPRRTHARPVIPSPPTLRRRPRRCRWLSLPPSAVAVRSLACAVARL